MHLCSGAIASCRIRITESTKSASNYNCNNFSRRRKDHFEQTRARAIGIGCRATHSESLFDLVVYTARLQQLLDHGHVHPFRVPFPLAAATSLRQPEKHQRLLVGRRFLVLGPRDDPPLERPELG
ncbi:MAG: hypothetical protein GY820_21025 [Gammaproteobacteria bacterium]|nr:hypothetical protein [Gammaproteobacteria bacterium]